MDPLEARLVTSSATGPMILRVDGARADRSREPAGDSREGHQFAIRCQFAFSTLRLNKRQFALQLPEKPLVSAAKPPICSKYLVVTPQRSVDRMVRQQCNIREVRTHHWYSWTMSDSKCVTVQHKRPHKYHRQHLSTRGFPEHKSVGRHLGSNQP